MSHSSLSGAEMILVEFARSLSGAEASVAYTEKFALLTSSKNLGFNPLNASQMIEASDGKVTGGMRILRLLSRARSSPKKLRAV